MHYDDIQALNWSTLKHMDGTAKRARHIYDHPEEQVDKVAYKEGRIIHCATFEPDEFDGRYEVMPIFSGKGSVAAKKEYKESLAARGIEGITQAEYDMAWRAAGAVHADEHASKYLEGASFEHIVTWEIDRIRRKGRVDVASDRIADLKKTRHYTLYDIENDAARYNYHAQLAWYHDGAVSAGLISGEHLPVVIFVHASPKSTYTDVAVLDMDGMDGTLAYGRGKYQALLKKYIGCNAADWWPGMAPRPVPWGLPEWKLRADEDEVRI